MLGEVGWEVGGWCEPVHLEAGHTSISSLGASRFGSHQHEESGQGHAFSQETEGPLAPLRRACQRCCDENAGCGYSGCSAYSANITCLGNVDSTMLESDDKDKNKPTPSTYTRNS